MDQGTAPQQPWLHDLALTLAAPTQVWSGQDGQVRPGGLSGFFQGDRRMLSLLVLEVDGAEPTPVGHHARSGDEHTFVAVPRHLGDGGADPTVRVVRRRDVEPGLVRERYQVSSTAAEPFTCVVGLRIGADRSGLDVVKSGAPTPVVVPEGVGGHVLPGRTAARAGCSDCPVPTPASGTAKWWPSGP